MARFVPTANRLLAVLLTENNSLAISRRGYAVERTVTTLEKKLVKGSVDSSSSSSWMPDPLTGYYKPASRAAEIDPVELRNMLLSKR